MARAKKKWYGYVQINGDEVSYYLTPTFSVSDELYEKIQDAIKQNIPLTKCDFYHDIVLACEDSIDLMDYIDIHEDKPKRADYDDRDDYRAALDEYNSMIETALDECNFESVSIYDPGDFTRLKEKFVGRVFTKFAASEDYEKSFEINDVWNFHDFNVTVSFAADGTIKDISEITAKGLESETLKSSRYGECYPNYGFIEASLESILNSEKE